LTASFKGLYKLVPALVGEDPKSATLLSKSGEFAGRKFLAIISWLTS